MALLFELTDEQEQQWNKFNELVNEVLLQEQIKAHKGGPDNDRWSQRTCNWTSAYTGVSGGHVSVSFAPTSLGVSVLFHCAGMGLSYDATDYDSW